MSANIFNDKKCLHVQLDSDVHIALRIKLFQHKISLQELFNHYAVLLSQGNANANKILEGLVQKKLLDAIAGRDEKKKLKSLNEFDTDALYTLINDASDDDVDEDRKNEK